jgi:hypothetical protein
MQYIHDQVCSFLRLHSIPGSMCLHYEWKCSKNMTLKNELDKTCARSRSEMADAHEAGRTVARHDLPDPGGNTQSIWLCHRSICHLSLTGFAYARCEMRDRSFCVLAARLGYAKELEASFLIAGELSRSPNPEIQIYTQSWATALHHTRA